MSEQENGSRTMVPTRVGVNRISGGYQLMFNDGPHACGGEPYAQQAAGTSEYKGKTYYFCSKGCKKAFDKEPEHYLDGAHGGHGGHGGHEGHQGHGHGM